MAVKTSLNASGKDATGVSLGNMNAIGTKGRTLVTNPIVATCAKGHSQGRTT